MVDQSAIQLRAGELNQDENPNYTEASLYTDKRQITGTNPPDKSPVVVFTKLFILPLGVLLTRAKSFYVGLFS